METTNGRLLLLRPSRLRFGSATDYQKSVGNVWLEAVGLARNLLRASKPRKIEILQGLDGLVRDGEMLVVLGPLRRLAR
jgi:hypothetical protein